MHRTDTVVYEAIQSLIAQGQHDLATRHIAGEAHVATNTVMRSVARLETAGILAVERRRGRRGHSYRLCGE